MEKLVLFIGYLVNLIGSKVIAVVILTFLGLTVISFLVLGFKFLLNKTPSLSGFKSLSLLFFTLTSLLTVSEWFFIGKIFNSFVTVGVFLGLNVIVYCCLFITLILLKGFSKIIYYSKNANDKKALVKQNVIEEPSKDLSELTLKQDFNYINVTKIKSLIFKLKQQNDYFKNDKYLEEFEVYLMNFASRQPNKYERQKLNVYLDYLITNAKKLKVV